MSFKLTAEGSLDTLRTLDANKLYCLSMRNETPATALPPPKA